MRVVVTPLPTSLRSSPRRKPLAQTSTLLGACLVSVAIASCEEYTCVDTATCSFAEVVDATVIDADVSVVSPEAGAPAQVDPDASPKPDASQVHDPDASASDHDETAREAGTISAVSNPRSGTAADVSHRAHDDTVTSDTATSHTSTSHTATQDDTASASRATLGSTGSDEVASSAVLDTSATSASDSELPDTSDYAWSETVDTASSTAPSSDTEPPVECAGEPDTVPIDASGVVVATCNNAGINGEWYCFDDGVNPSGCPHNAVPFDASRSGMCLTGTTTVDEDFAAWGAGIGLTLNSNLAWNATSHHVIGFKIGMTGSSGGVTLRLSFANTPNPSDIPPSYDLPGPDEYYVLFDDAHIPDWAGDNAGDPTDPTAIYSFSLAISGGTQNASYDFCITELTPIFDQ